MRNLLVTIFGWFLVFSTCHCSLSQFNLQWRDQPTNIRTTRRASLHELLKMNRNVASVEPEGATKAGAEEHHDEKHGSEPAAAEERMDTDYLHDAVPEAATNNKNRRVLVVGEADNPPNYVYDEPLTPDIDDVDFNADHDSKDDSKNRNVGDSVTKYTHPIPFGVAPSYADPELLSAVMTQADKANFRYPGHKPPQTREYYHDQNEPTVNPKESVEFQQETSDFNPYKLFPPAFHELLNIPMHIHANGSAKKSPEDVKPKLIPPKITLGYANTNMNGHPSAATEPDYKHEETLTRYQPVRPALKHQLSLQRTTAYTTPSWLSYTTKKTTARSTVRPFRPTSLLRRPTYNEIRKRLKKRKPDNPDPKPNSNSHSNKTPSSVLNFTQFLPRVTTYAPPPLNLYTATTSSTIYKRPIYQDIGNNPQESIGLRESYVTVPDIHYFTDYKTPRPSLRFRTRSHELAVTEPTRQPTTKQSNYYRVSAPAPTVSPEITSYKETFNVNEPMKSKHYYDYETLRISSTPKPEQDSTANYFSTAIYPDISVSEHNLVNSHILTKTSESEVRPLSTAPFDYRPQSPTSKPSFKPSKIDPFIGRESFYPPFLKLSGNNDLPVPTTFRPQYHSHGNIHSPVTDTLTSYEGYKFQPGDVPVKSEIYTDTEIYNNNEKNGNNHNLYLERDDATAFPFARHPSMDKHTFVQYGNSRPGPPNPFFPLYYEKDTQPLQTYDKQYSALDSSLRPPPSYKQSNSSPENSGYLRTHPRRTRKPPKRSHPYSKDRPSFLENFGFFSQARQVNRRSGATGPSADINRIKYTNQKDVKKGYILTKGPIPPNAQKVTVIGPFKEPPVGAPIVYPHHPPMLEGSPLPTEPSAKLIPPAPTKQVMNVIETNTREPSFKVISLPKEKGMTVHVNKSSKSSAIDFPLEKEINGLNHEHGGHLQTLNQKKPFLSKKIDTSTENSTSVNDNDHLSHDSRVFETGTVFHVKNSGTMTSTDTHFKLQSYQDEVSEADKERLIAAKFYFPRAPAIRRSGLKPHVIPIPVPMMTSSGKQITHLHRIILPHIHYDRKLPVFQHRKMPLSDMNVDRTQPTENYRSSAESSNNPELRMKNFNNIYAAGIKLPHDPQSSLVSKKSTGNVPDISQSSLVNSHKNDKSSQNISLGTARTLEIITPRTPTYITPFRVTPYPTQSPEIQNEIREDLQSFQEPDYPGVNYGGWKVVGVSKVDPNGALDPVISYIKESTPDIGLRSSKESIAEPKASSNNEMKNSEINYKQDIKNDKQPFIGNEPETEAQRNDAKSPEQTDICLNCDEPSDNTMVSYSSKLEVESPANAAIKSELETPVDQ